MVGDHSLPRAMLDLQRDKYRPMIEKRTFARNFVLMHLVVGAVISALLLFHELFAISAGVLLWYLVSVGLVVGMMHRVEWCRLALALLFLLMGASAAVFITRIYPTLTLEHEPMLSRKNLPLWGAVATVGYLLGGIMILASNRLKRATTLGFSIW
jgi:hypothetical protein